MAVVVDSSLLLAHMLREPTAAFAQQVLERAVDLGAMAPALLPFEIVSVLSVKRRRGDLSEAERDALLHTFPAYAIRLEPTLPSQSLQPVAAVAERYGLTGYDAAYLELALRAGAEIGTFDDALAAAAKASGLIVHHA